MNGNNGLFLFCNTTTGGCLRVNPKTESFIFIGPNSVLTHVYKTPAPVNITKLFPMLVKLLGEDDILPGSFKSFFRYHKIAETFYTRNKLNTNILFGNNTDLGKKYYESFLTTVKILRTISKSEIITPDLEEFESFMLVAPIQDEISVMFVKLMKSLYRPRDGKFSSKFARLLYKLKTVDLSKKDRIKYIKGVIDVIGNIGMKYKTFNEAMDYFSSTHKI